MNGNGVQHHEPVWRRGLQGRPRGRICSSPLLSAARTRQTVRTPGGAFAGLAPQAAHGPGVRHDAAGRFVERMEDLLPWKEQWDRLCLRQPRPNPMLTWDWIEAWWQVYGAGDPSVSLRFWLLTEGPRLLAAIPLYRREAKQAARYYLVGSGEAASEEVCADYLGPLIDPDADPSVRQRIGEVLADLPGASNETLWLQHMAEEDLLTPSLTSVFQSAGLAVRSFSGPPCPYLPLAATWDEQLSRFSGNFRSQYRRSFRAWQEAADPSVVWHDQSGTLDEFWSHLVGLHQARWTSRGRTGVFASPRFNAFHREILARFHRRNWLLAGSLRSEGRTIAVNYSFRLGGAIFHYQSGVATPWSAKWSPGVLLHAEVIRRGIAEGLEEYDFLRGPDEYKWRFTDLSRMLLSLEVSRPGLRRALSWWLDSAKDRLRPICGRLIRR